MQHIFWESIVPNDFSYVSSLTIGQLPVFGLGVPWKPQCAQYAQYLLGLEASCGKFTDVSNSILSMIIAVVHMQFGYTCGKEHNESKDILCGDMRRMNRC